MSRLRILVWLIALVALVAPPGMTLHALAAPAAGAVAVDCHDHAPPPDPCPDDGSAKHAASTCCPLMAGAVALLSSMTAVEVPFAFDAHLMPRVRSLSGLIPTKDPPPPRV
jgi:hypothetical protein